MNETERAEWLANRRKGITGTDIAAILGLSPYAGQFEVWMEKKGLSTPKEETPQMRWGKKLESAIREMYEEETGWAVVQPGFRVNEYDSLIIGTPDGLARDGEIVDDPTGQTPYLEAGRVLEIKTARTSQGWGEAGTDQIPQYYLLQAAWYMALCDYSVCDVAVLIGGSDFRIYHLTRDLELERHLIEMATAWWHRHVIADVAPDIDGSDGAGRYLAYRYPRNTAPLKEATAEINELLFALRKAKATIADYEMYKGSLENQLKAFIGDGDGVEGIHAKATWKSTKDAVKTDWETLARQLLASLPKAEADAYLAANTATKPGARRFIFTAKEGE